MSEELQPAQSTEPKRVVYLIGAGASHACAKALGSSQGILMRDLNDEIAEGVRIKAQTYGESSSVARLANEVIGDGADVEQVITFLDESSSGEHQRFANDLRQVFEEVLRRRIDAIQKELHKVPADLYAALIDMHAVEGFTEQLVGIMTLNYDVFLEYAVEALLDLRVDYGISVNHPCGSHKAIRVIKLHGSLGWRNAWPVELKDDANPLWIPPGIQKAKSNYPFNLLWGRARELLDCDVVRIVGCNLGANDWDLVSMLFSAKHAHKTARSYEIEIIGPPNTARRIGEQFPYLDARSLLELERVGEHIVAEMIGGDPRPYLGLPRDQQEHAFEKAEQVSNPLHYWLKQKAEAIFRELGSLKTDKGFFNSVLESY